MDTQTNTPAKFSIPSVIAVVSAIGSFMVGAFWGFVLAMIALLFGAIGFMLAFSSRVRGGVVSVFAIGAGLLGLIAAVVKAIAWLAR
jgi:hypothetical protein